MADRIVFPFQKELFKKELFQKTDAARDPAGQTRPSEIDATADILLTVLKQKLPDEVREDFVKCAFAAGLDVEKFVESHRIAWAVGFYYGALEARTGVKI